MDKCIESRGQEYLMRIFEDISKAMKCENPDQAIVKFREILKEMELKNPVGKDREEELKVLSASVNPVRLKNNPIKLDETTIKSIYEIIVA